MKTSNLYWVLPFVLLGCKDTTQTAETVTVAPVETVTDLVASVQVSNPSTFARPDTLISLSLNELGVTNGPLQVWQGDTAQASQLVDDNADGTADRLVFLTNLDAAATHEYVIDRQEAEQTFSARAQAEVSIK